MSGVQKLTVPDHDAGKVKFVWMVNAQKGMPALKGGRLFVCRLCRTHPTCQARNPSLKPMQSSYAHS